MGIGGFSNDPTPTLAQFQKYVADNEIGYYVVTASGPGSADRAPSGSTYTHSAGGSRSGSVTVPIQQWVASHYTGHTVGDYTVYDLRAGMRSAGSSTSVHTAATQQQGGRPMPTSQSGYRHRFHHLAHN